MSPLSRTSAFLSLLLALPLHAANQKTGGVPGITPIPLATLPSSLSPALPGTQVGSAFGLTPLATLPSAAAPRVVTDLSLAPAPKLSIAPIALPAGPAFSLPSGLAGAGQFSPAAAAAGAKADQSIAGQLGRQSGEIAAAIANDPSGLAAQAGLDTLYFGRGGKKNRHGRGGSAGPVDAGSSRANPALSTVFIVNDEGVQINGRAAAYYKEVRRLVEKYKDRLDLAESLDVMDDTYADVWAKLAAIEGLAKARGIEKHNTHLEETLLWVDGTMTDDQGRKIAVHTHRVYFHHSKSAGSEINEGIRRVDRYIEDALKNFAPGGKAESVLGDLSEVVLAFDSRGYDQIKQHLKQRERELSKTHGRRFRFAYVDELARVPKNKEGIRSELNGFVKKYKGKGLQKIIEGVIYSRYVGILLELKTVEHFMNEGYEILQSGRDLFDADNNYITELDTVVRSPEGRTYVVEAKSARVKLPNEEALEDKVLYKLRTYRKNRQRMEEVLGSSFDVVFSFDVGDNQDLAAFLKSKEQELSDEFGFQVSFLFIQSAPEDEAGAPQQGKLKKGKRRR